MVTYIALAHSAAYIKGHCRAYRVGILVLEHYAAYLRAVSVGNNDLISLAYYVRDILGGLFDYFKLSLCRCRLARFLKGVSAKCDNYLFHIVSLS